MPKDPTENIARYKIRGGHMNEYEFQQNQEALAESPQEEGRNLIPGTPPEKRAKQIQSLTKAVAKKATKNRNATSKGTTKKSAAKQSSAKKTTTKKKSASKAAKKASGKKRTRK